MRYQDLLDSLMDTTYEDLDLMMSEFDSKYIDKIHDIQEKILEFMKRFKDRAEEMFEEANQYECENCQYYLQDRDLTCNKCGSTDIEIE